MMEDSIKNINDIVLFQVVRQLRNISKQSLILSEESHNYIKVLEKLLLDMGITKFEYSNYSYEKDRKKILDALGSAERELSPLIQSLDIRFKK